MDEVLKRIGHLLMARTAVTESHRPELIAQISSLKKEFGMGLPVAGITLVAMNEHDRRPFDSRLGLVVVMASPPTVKTAGVPGKPCRIRSRPLTCNRAATISTGFSKMRDIRPKGC
jgi:hypothetical protein